MKFLFIFLLLFGCGNEQIECALKGCSRKMNPTAEIPVTAEQTVLLKLMKFKITPWLLYCEGGIACHENAAGEPQSGDGILWGGLLCSVGIPTQCTATRASQSEAGQIYRNPGGTRGKNDSSRDMLLGFLSYLVATKDLVAAKRLISYIEANSYRLCNNATDNRCSVNSLQYSAVWGTIKRVWGYLDLKPTQAMEVGDFLDDSIVDLQSKFVAEGYTLHLVGVELMLRQQTNTFTSQLQKAADNLLARQPDNPFFEYLANGKTMRAARLVLEKCPIVQPFPRSQWSWQRSESEEAWLSSMGHDCIFIANLLLRGE